MVSQKPNIDESVPKSLREQVSEAKQSQILGWEYPYTKKMKREEYENTKLELQIELLKLENWVKKEKEKIVIIFEGRDAGGKGGTIKRFMEQCV